jgi:hypothetical protein
MQTTGMLLQGFYYRDGATGMVLQRYRRDAKPAMDLGESRPRVCAARHGPAERWLVAPRASRLNISCRTVRRVSVGFVSISCVSVRELSTA